MSIVAMLATAPDSAHLVTIEARRGDKVAVYIHAAPHGCVRGEHASADVAFELAVLQMNNKIACALNSANHADAEFSGILPQVRS